MVKFSIVIPCYNCEKFLDECFLSLKEQTYRNFEIIAVDDGSSDDTLKILNRLKREHRNLRIISQENKGGIIARKNGIDVSVGDYVLLMDSDDWLEKNALVKLNGYIQKFDAPDMIKFRYMNEPSKKESPKYTNVDGPNLIAGKDDFAKVWDLLLYTDTFNSIWSCVFKKNFFSFEDDIYKHIVHKGEDLQINLQLVQYVKRILLVDDILYHYRKNSEGITQLVDKEKMVRNCADRLYLTNKKIEIFKNIYDKDVDNAVIKSGFASLVVSQMVKVLVRRDVRRVDMDFIQKELAKTDVVDFLRDVERGSISYRGSNRFLNYFLDNILENICSNNVSKNYKYRRLFKMYYFIKK